MAYLFIYLSTVPMECGLLGWVISSCRYCRVQQLDWCVAIVLLSDFADKVRSLICCRCQWCIVYTVCWLCAVGEETTVDCL